MRTNAELRADGLRALMEALGARESERFVASMPREPFDYTEWQRNLWSGETVEEISTEAAKLRKAPPDPR